MSRAYLEKRTDRFEAARARRRQFESQRLDDRKRLAAIVEPAHAKILATRGTTRLAPVARWEFDGNLKDSIGTLHGTAYLGAKLVDDHGGIVDLDTAPGNTTFRILLPMLKEKFYNYPFYLENNNLILILNQYNIFHY